MARVGDALQLYDIQRRRFQRVASTVKNVMEWSARQGRVDLHELTSGDVSTKQLRRLGHPYARDPDPATGTRVRRRVGRGKMERVIGRRSLPPYPINAQNGELRGGIYLNRLGRNVFELGSRAPHARYQFSPWGTRFMIRRGVMGGRKLASGVPPGQLELRWRARNHVIRRAIRAKYRP